MVVFCSMWNIFGGLLVKKILVILNKALYVVGFLLVWLFSS